MAPNSAIRAGMDPLSEILKSAKVQQAALGAMQLSAPWGFVQRRFDTPTMYALAEGPPFWVQVSEREPVRVEQGDIVLFVNAPDHRLMSAPGVLCDDLGEALRAHGVTDFVSGAEPALPVPFTWGRGGERSRVLAFAFAFGAPGQYHPLRGALPDMIILRKGSNGEVPWIHTTLDYFLALNNSAMGFAATGRLCAELIFISVVRAYLLEQASVTRGWLRGLTDPCIARALQAMHARPGADWTVGELAQVAGLSRTALATRFVEMVETTPIEYLTQWRMHLAAERIRNSQPNLTRLAFELGYSSDSAFRDAFKRCYGVPPSRYGRQAEPGQHPVE